MSVSTAQSAARIDILSRDENLIALAKPSGLSVLRDRSGMACLWDQLPELIGGKPYQVHRIDKGTSGVLLVARNAQAQKSLTRSFQNRSVRKFYLAWVTGRFRTGGVIDLPLRRGRKSRFRVAGQREDIRFNKGVWHLNGAPAADGLSSSTRVRPLLTQDGQTLLLLQPLTGRTHQLRVHLSWIGHPILGDELYGRPADPAQQAGRLLLHCHRLIVPGWGVYTAPLPPDWRLNRPATERPRA